MISLIPVLIIILMICFILFFFSSPAKVNIDQDRIEQYLLLPYYYPNYYPYWNASTRHTRNMSYDLRGDVPIGQPMLLPFNMSPLVPIQQTPFA